MMGNDGKPRSDYGELRMKKYLLMAALLTTGCSAIFMERLPDRPTGKEPRCTGTKGFVAWDGVLVVAHSISALLALKGASDYVDIDGDPNRSAVKSGFRYLAFGNAVFALGHIVSGVKGSGWADACNKARDERDVERPPIVVVRPRAPATVRGFYCAATFCSRRKLTCEQVRIAGAEPDACGLTEGAFCSKAACGRTMDACAKSLEISGMVDTTCELKNEDVKPAVKVAPIEPSRPPADSEEPPRL